MWSPWTQGENPQNAGPREIQLTTDQTVKGDQGEDHEESLTTESGVAVAQLESKAESRWPRVSHSQVSAVDQHLTKEVQDASQSEEDAEVQRNRNQHETQKAVEMVYSFFFFMPNTVQMAKV